LELTGKPQWENFCLANRLLTGQSRVESSSFALNRAVRQTSIICAADIARQQRRPELKKCLLTREFNTEIGVFKSHIWTAESSLTNILATFSKLKNTIKKCLLFVKFTWKISFLKCGTRTAYKILSVYLKSTSFCTEDACTEIDILCTEVDCTDISYVPKVTVPILTFNVPKPAVPKKHVPKVYVPKLSCTESDVPRDRIHYVYIILA